MKVLVITISLGFSLILLLCGCRSRRVVETQAENIQASSLFHTASGQVMIIKRPSLYVEPAPSTEDTTQPPYRVVRKGRTPTPDTTKPHSRDVKRGRIPITPDTTIITWNVQDTSASSLHKSNHSVIAQRNQDNIIADVTARALTNISLSALALFCCILIFLVLKLLVSYKKMS